MSLQLYSSNLLLEDGSTYKGWSFFDNIYSIGEVVFNTGMTGYQEIMTDPSYAGQIITFTYPELGNTGLNKDDYESNRISIKGIIAKNICYYPSNWRSIISLPEYLFKNKVPHIFGIDTRALTQHLRIRGVMKGIICNFDNVQLNHLKRFSQNQAFNECSLVNSVTVSRAYYINFDSFNKSLYSHLNYKISQKRNSLFKLNIVVLDFGVKYNIINRLLSYGCNVYGLPVTSSYEVIRSYKPDGIILSNGPGDPDTITYTLESIKQLVNQPLDIPIFGICMGHQILSLALGSTTFKLKFGHRGINHPIGIGSKAEITSQNHGFAVKAEFLNNQDVYITHMNLNDSTVAGIIHKNKPVFSVQYHPEASPGPHDSEYLFKYFIRLIKFMKSKNKQLS